MKALGARRPRSPGECVGTQSVPRAYPARIIVLADARGILWRAGSGAPLGPVTGATQISPWVHAETP